jgi:hypothetical protein
MKSYLRAFRATVIHFETRERLSRLRTRLQCTSAFLLLVPAATPTYKRSVTRVDLKATSSTFLSYWLGIITSSFTIRYLRNISRCQEIFVLCVISTEECVSISDGCGWRPYTWLRYYLKNDNPNVGLQQPRRTKHWTLLCVRYRPIRWNVCCMTTELTVMHCF